MADKELSYIPGRHLRALIYGDSGIGKTQLLGSFQDDPRSAPVLHINSEGQKITLSLRDDKPCIIDLEELVDLNPPFNWLLQGQPSEVSAPLPVVRAMLDYLAEWGESNGVESPRFKTVTIDSITSVQRKSQDLLAGNKSVGPGSIPNSAQLRDWGGIFAQLMNMTRLFKRLPLHFLITTTCKRDEIRSTNIATAYPSLWGQGSLEIPSLMDLSGHLIAPEELNIQQLERFKKYGIKEAYNVLLTKREAGRTTKWQGIHKPPPLVIGPTATKLLNILYRMPE